MPRIDFDGVEDYIDPKELDKLSFIIKRKKNMPVPYSYRTVKKAFLERKERDRNAWKNKDMLVRIVEVFLRTKVIRREDLAEELNCKPDSINRTINLLKKYGLVKSTKYGYVRKSRFDEFLQRLVREHPGFLYGGEKREKEGF